MNAPKSRAPGVLLISPGIIKWTDLDYGLPHMVSMGGYLQSKVDVRVEILDLNYEGGDHRQLLRTIEELGPHLLIGVSCYSSFDYLRVMALARFLRRHYPETPVVTGGYHATALPEELVFDGSPFDAVIVGEGERPLYEMVTSLLGGGELRRGVHGPSLVENLDDLPPYRWELLQRYWPRAHDIGGKFQIYLSRGCPYRCTFCMERAKGDYRWRAYSPERAVAELERLSTFTDLGRWIVNVADPLFGRQRSWRREVLRGIIDKQLFPRQYWTLTRSDDLEDEDVELLARARFSIGIGLESGSPRMLDLMQKGNKPRPYLDAMLKLARSSRKHGLNWASNVIVGHPGESMASMVETRDYLRTLFMEAPETCGWLSIDPFRLYPGAHVHEAMATYETLHGTRFHHPNWWHSWYDGGFRAEHLDPSREIDFEARVRFMYEAYGPLVAEVSRRFRGQGRSVDRVYARSIAEQAKLMSPQARDSLLVRGRRTLADLQRRDGGEAATSDLLQFPLGLHVRDPWIRRREDAVRRLLECGVLRSAALVEALLVIDPRDYMSDEETQALFEDRVSQVETLGELPATLGLRHVGLGIEALEPGMGDVVADLTARRGYVARVLAELVGEEGEVYALHPAGSAEFETVRDSLEELDHVRLRAGSADDLIALDDDLDGIWLGAAMPRFPRSLVEHMRDPGGRAVTFVGPRFRAQDMVCVTREGDEARERLLARTLVPILAGPLGWVRRSALATAAV